LGCDSLWPISDSILVKSCLSARHGWSRPAALNGFQMSFLEKKK
jgi:hypothetical protein